MRRVLATFVLFLALLFVPTHAVLAQESDDDDEGDRVTEDIEREDGESVEPQLNVLSQPATALPQERVPSSEAPTTVDEPAPVETPVVAVPGGGVVAVEASAPPAVSTTPAPTPSPEFPWAWVVTRAAGIASILFLTLLTLTGMLLTTGILFRFMSPAVAWSFHRAFGSVLLFSILAHVGALPFDHFINLRLVDVLVPFVSPYRPLLIALGIGGFYLMLLILASSLYTLTSHAKFWRTVHAFSFPMLLLISLHSILLGTDTKEWWMQAVYWSCAIAVTLAALYRLRWKYRSRHSPTAAPDRAAAPPKGA